MQALYSRIVALLCTALLVAGLAVSAPADGEQAVLEPLGVRAARMLKELDTLKGNIKAIAIIELDQLGDSTLYEYLHFRNPGDEPMETLSGVGSFAAIPYLAVGGEQAEVEFGEYLPNKIERKFTARLRRPVPPGEWVEMIMVGERVAKYKATRFEDGRWRFGPVTAEVSDPSMCVFAVKLSVQYRFPGAGGDDQTSPIPKS